MASIAIVGGGITGLTAAYRLKQRGSRVVVYEASDRIGGAIKSERRNGYLAELGPNSLATPTAGVAALLAELGLDSHRVAAAAEARTRYIVRRGRLMRLPMSPAELLTSRLFSNAAKLAIFGEPLLDASETAVDESVAAFVRRRFNQEVVDYLANPFVAGTFAGDPEQLSIRHALPQLQALERTQGSLVKAFVRMMKGHRANIQGQGSPGSIMSFREGLQELPDALGRELSAEVRLRSPVTQLRQSPRGWTVGAALQTPELYDAVIYAAPAHSLDEIDLDLPGGERLSTLSSIVHPPVAVLALGFRREQVSHPLDGFGFLTPEVERRRVLGVVFSSTIFPDRAPEGHVMLTAFVGGTRDPDFVQADPQTLTARVLDDLRVLLGAQGEPTFRAVQVWPKAIPQYVLGYGRFKDIADEVERRNPGLLLAGTYRDGVSLAEAMGSGERAATRAAELLGVEPVAAGSKHPARTASAAGQD
ncbi:MAG TPA: protoporphyrinogen oxidase [Gemmatimonadales bacterium]|jgi:oxygen-dependent protoporphyrinogen oxidase|nr:protoporphyrinogen oxidase [Gemmatimonadales bacterium]